MTTQIHRCAMPVIIALALLLSSCATGGQLSTGPGVTWDLVIIGDSSLWELGDAYASQIESDLGVTVVVHDFANQAGSAGEVLEVLQTGSSLNRRLEDLPESLSDAEVVVIFLNPEDSIDPLSPLDFNGCFFSQTPNHCPPESFEKWTSDLKAIWREIFNLRNGQPVILRATDLYNPLIQPWTENGVLEACTECWENMSEAARLAADAYGIPFLSRLDAFNGPNHDEDPRVKGYIVSDGEHPSELAAEYTAQLLSDLGYAPVPPP